MQPILFQFPAPKMVSKAPPRKKREQKLEDFSKNYHAMCSERQDRARTIAQQFPVMCARTLGDLKLSYRPVPVLLSWVARVSQVPMLPQNIVASRSSLSHSQLCCFKGWAELGGLLVPGLTHPLADCPLLRDWHESGTY